MRTLCTHRVWLLHSLLQTCPSLQQTFCIPFDLNWFCIHFNLQMSAVCMPVYWLEVHLSIEASIVWGGCELRRGAQAASCFTIRNYSLVDCSRAPCICGLCDLIPVLFSCSYKQSVIHRNCKTNYWACVCMELSQSFTLLLLLLLLGCYTWYTAVFLQYSSIIVLIKV